MRSRWATGCVRNTAAWTPWRDPAEPLSAVERAELLRLRKQVAEQEKDLAPLGGARPGGTPRSARSARSTSSYDQPRPIRPHNPVSTFRGNLTYQRGTSRGTATTSSTTTGTTSPFHGTVDAALAVTAWPSPAWLTAAYPTPAMRSSATLAARIRHVRRGPEAGLGTSGSGSAGRKKFHLGPDGRQGSPGRSVA